MANLSPNQQARMSNIEMIEIGASFVGLIGGVVYSRRTGGGFIRNLGWGFAGSVATTLVTRLATTPAKNKILKEAENNPVLTLPDSSILPDQSGYAISELISKYG